MASMHRAVRRDPRPVDGAAPQHDDAVGRGGAGDLVGRRRLADAGFADEHDHATGRLGPQPADPAEHVLDLAGATDEDVELIRGPVGQRRELGRQPWCEQLEHPLRLAERTQHVFAEIDDLNLAGVAGRDVCPSGCRQQDLTPLRDGAQAGDPVDRRPGQLAGVVVDLAEVDRHERAGSRCASCRAASTASVTLSNRRRRRSPGGRRRCRGLRPAAPPWADVRRAPGRPQRGVVRRICCSNMARAAWADTDLVAEVATQTGRRPATRRPDGRCDRGRS